MASQFFLLFYPINVKDLVRILKFVVCALSIGERTWPLKICVGFFVFISVFLEALLFYFIHTLFIYFSLRVYIYYFILFCYYY